MQHPLPCWVGEDPDNGTCRSALAYSIVKGEIEGVDVSGLVMGVAAFIPGNTLKGNFRVIRYIDDRASPAQEKALLAAFRGDMAGLLAQLAALVGEEVAARRAKLTFDVREGKGRLVMGKSTEAEMEPYLGPTGEPGRRGWWRASSPPFPAPPPMWPRPRASAWRSRRSASASISRGIMRSRVISR